MELASLVGTDQAHISRIENSEVTPATDLLTKIAHTLDMTLSQLIGQYTREAQKGYSVNRRSTLTRSTICNSNTKYADQRRNCVLIYTVHYSQRV